ncbi:MAG: DNA polymerase III subunit alpha [Eubacterium sp.]|nr:DNA polymerase III subunit alpha [Eubacterium sp.]
MAFVHLHVHSEYSLLDGMARISQAPAKAKEMGMNALAITDHGAMFGVIDFYKECRKQGIKPIIGCEVYTAMRRMEDKDPVKDRARGHLILLAENNEGYHNLIKIVSDAYKRGFYFKPRVDKEELRAHSKGIIALSACLAGRVQFCLLNRDYDGARREALELQDIFGVNNFFLEIQDHGLPEDEVVNPQLKKLSKELGIPLLATNDVHYVRQEDAEAHDVLLAIQTATSIHDPKRMRFKSDQFYLKSEKEMRALFPDIPEAVENTQKIADRCNVTFTFGEYHLPEFQPPAGMTNDEYLRKLCWDGLQQRYEQLTDKLKKRLEYELSTIEQMGYVEYFLIVWDFINYAKSHGIAVGPGRGSAAGSLVAYCLRITDIDPIKYDLIFERFLNPERVSMPDIDVDFDIERRSEVIDYVRRKYGKDNVSQIITFGTLKPKAAVRDVGRAMDVSYSDTDRIAKAIPFDLNMTLDKALEVSPELKKMYEENGQVRKVIDMSRALEGMPRHASTHAAGVVISKKPLDEYVPLYMSDHGIATQFNMTTIEELGLLKMDFLGLRNLTVIRDALQMIRDDHGVELDFAKMGYDDPKVYQMIASGDTEGVFQLESEGMTSFMKALKPTCFEDIVAGISLYRPGPMDSIPTYIENKKHPDKIKYVTPELAPILDVTYGCLVYQEQVMRIVRDLAGYSYGRSDIVRRAMSKKKKQVMMEEKEYFIHGKLGEDGNVEIPGCVRNGISEEAAEQIFSDMETFAQYAFNKSHAAAYAVLAFETAYLKCYYPVEFMAALMSSMAGDAKQTAKYIRNCREHGIEVLGPSVNESGVKFTVQDGKIRFGLLGVKNVGEGAIEEIIRARETMGKPEDIFQFIDNIDVSIVNKKAVESLIKAGALDCLNPNRAAHLAVYETLMESAQANAKKNIAGQISLFQTAEAAMDQGDVRVSLPKVENFDRRILLAMEKEMLGVYISGHPLDDYADEIRRVATVNSQQLDEAGKQSAEDDESDPGYFPGDARAQMAQTAGTGGIRDKMHVVMAGMIIGKKTLITKKNQIMAFVDLEDLYGQTEVVVFPRVLEQYQTEIYEDNVVVIKGRLDFREGETPKLLAESVEALNAGASAENREFLKVRIPENQDERLIMKELADIFKDHRGPQAALIYRKNRKAVRTGRNAGITISENLLEKIGALVGEENVKISSR